MMLVENGWEIHTDAEGLYAFVKEVSQENACLWLKKHAKKYLSNVTLRAAISGSYIPIAEITL